VKQGATSSFIEPMMALRVRELPAGDWVYELKYDGYRALAFKSGSDVQLVSRNRTSFNKAYPQLIEALKSLPAKNAVIDGEIAALDQNGKSSFQLLQAYGKSKEAPLIYFAFDLLSLEGKDLRNRPLVERRKLLAKLLEKAPDNIRFSEESPRSCCIGFAACFLRLWVLRRHKLKIHFAKLSGQQNSRSRFHLRNAQKLVALNTAVKRRAGQEDAESDYLFANFLAEEFY
jgi:ATP dependent DNA ligase domain